MAFTLLTIALLVILVFQSAQPSANFWPSFVSLLPMLGLLLIVDRVGTMLWSIAYLVIGGLGVHFYAVGILSLPTAIYDSDGFSFLAVKIALIMVGGSVLGIVAGVAFAVAGYVIAELAIGLAQMETGVPFHFETAPFFTLVVTLLIIVLIGVTGTRRIWALSQLQRAAHEEHVAGLRNTIEVKAAALMHDTALNDLAAIADSTEDQLDVVLRKQIQRDVASLTGEEWLTAKPQISLQTEHPGWQDSGLFTAVRESRALGLTITMTGELTSVSRLSEEAAVALGHAVQQCLINVLKHSGTRDAEVAVYSSESEVTVMVIDNGRGFVEATTGTDRLGLRSSVRKRIELVGGTVTVWSTLGRGTSIMIRVPVHSGASDSLAENTLELP